jgi:hypothetical protein
MRLRPIMFFSRRCQGAELDYHSYVGEAATGLWAIDKLRHLLWGSQFTWITDFSDLKRFFDGEDPPSHKLSCWCMQLLGYDFTTVHRPGTMLLECDLLQRYNGRAEWYRAKMSRHCASVNVTFLPGRNYYTSDKILSQHPLQEKASSVYSTQIASVGWLSVGPLAMLQQRVMKNICPELAPLLDSYGINFHDLAQAQRCLHESPDMLLYIRAFETSIPLSASLPWVQQCLQLVNLLFLRSTAQLSLCYSVHRSQFALLSDLTRLAFDRGFCSVIWNFDYQDFSCAIDGSCVCVLLSKVPFLAGKPRRISSE